MFASSSKAQGNEAALFLDIVWSDLEHLYQEVKQVERERAQGLGLTEDTPKPFPTVLLGVRKVIR
jgi:hypothetical protein